MNCELSPGSVSSFPGCVYMPSQRPSSFLKVVEFHCLGYDKCVNLFTPDCLCSYRPDDMEWSITNVRYSLSLYHSDLLLPVKSTLSLTLRSGWSWYVGKEKKKRTRLNDQRDSDQLQAPLLSRRHWGYEWGSAPFSDTHFWLSSSLAITSAYLPGERARIVFPEESESLTALPFLAIIAAIHVHCYHQAWKHQEKFHESPAFPASFFPPLMDSSSPLSSW